MRGRVETRPRIWDCSLLNKTSASLPEPGLVCRRGPSSGGQDSGVAGGDSPGGSLDLAADHLRGPISFTVDLDHLLSSDTRTLRLHPVREQGNWSDCLILATRSLGSPGKYTSVLLN